MNKTGASLIASLIILAFSLFSTTPARAAGFTIPQGFFFEHPYSITGASANLELVDLDSPPSGLLVMNQFRVDINLFQNLLGVYAKFPFAGVNDFGPQDEDDYDFGNIGLGGKFALVNMEGLILTGGLELILPTSSNGLGSQAARGYFRDFPYFLDDTTTLNPYLVLGIGRDIWALQANLGADIMLNADEIEGDDSELRFKYGLTGSYSPMLNAPFKLSFLLELLFASTTSFNDNRTEVFITPGIRLGGQIMSVGAGIQVPVGQDVNDFANANYFLDLVIRFGS
jgi:hypothetical protein